MSRKRRNKSHSPIWTWISFVVFGFLIVLFGSSIWHRQSPAKVMSNWFASDPSENPIDDMSKSALRTLAKEQASTLDSLREILYEYEEKVRSNIGIINTETASLNMRSAPSLTGDILMKIPNGSAVNILHYDDEEQMLDGKTGVWCRIQYNDNVGWVWGNYLLVNN